MREPAVVVSSSPAEVETTLRTFLHHFENLEWEPFIAPFDDDACVFHPTARTPQAFCGRDAVRAKWQQVFDDTRKDANGPPYMSLVPSDLHVAMHGADAALATFTLVNGSRGGASCSRAATACGRSSTSTNVPWPDLPAP